MTKRFFAFVTGPVWQLIVCCYVVVHITVVWKYHPKESNRLGNGQLSVSQQLMRATFTFTKLIITDKFKNTQTELTLSLWKIAITEI